MYSMRLFRVLLVLGLNLLTLGAYASAINVYPLEADLSFKDRYQDIKVINVGTDTAYVEVQIDLVQNPGLPNQKLLPLQDNPYQVGLIVTPNKMVIPVHQMRLARILYIGDPPTNNDVVYKVRIAPVSGQLVPVGNLNKNVAAGVDLIIAYSINVFIRPIAPAPKLVLLREGTDLTLKNVGNTNFLVGSCKQCAGKNCGKGIVLSKRMYVGETAHYTLPVAQSVMCEQIFEDQPAVKVSSN